MASAEASNKQSGAIISIVKSIFDPNDKIPRETFTTFVRKGAHFSEYMLLGAECMMWALFKNRFTDRKIKKRHVLGLGAFCLAVASIDEFIQLFSPGRACRLTDVMIDLAGSFCGIGFILLMSVLIRRRKRYTS